MVGVIVAAPGAEEDGMDMEEDEAEVDKIREGGEGVIMDKLRWVHANAMLNYMTPVDSEPEAEWRPLGPDGKINW
jgi:hypothetical protein